MLQSSILTWNKSAPFWLDNCVLLKMWDVFLLDLTLIHLDLNVSSSYLLKVCWPWSFLWQTSPSIFENIPQSRNFLDRIFAFTSIFIFIFLQDHLHNVFKTLMFFISFLAFGFPFLLPENISHKTFTLFKKNKCYL